MGLPAPEEVFPLVVPTEPDLSGYAGPVTLPGRDSADPPYLWLSLRSIPVGSPTMRGSVLQCNKALSVLLAGQDGVVLRFVKYDEKSGHTVTDDTSFWLTSPPVTVEAPAEQLPKRGSFLPGASGHPATSAGLLRNRHRPPGPRLLPHCAGPS
uniref:Uncharacterized protein n=1 Tax=Tetraselmis chuii TaxID=63592 RepID=A0A7S1T0D6_9CHLO|mmetsp:Transcript_37756/g.67674  ORF Transcript_37756/g.67674 Transcript_37756/m.67674 type:complete len:153 (+) Transcript_37756:269-727(+)